MIHNAFRLICASTPESLTKRFLEPLISIWQTPEGLKAEPFAPKGIALAKDFAVSLLQCRNDDEMRDIAKANPEGVEQFISVIAYLVIRQKRLGSGEVEYLEERGSNRFSLLASLVLEFLNNPDAAASED